MVKPKTEFKCNVIDALLYVVLFHIYKNRVSENVLSFSNDAISDNWQRLEVQAQSCIFHEEAPFLSLYNCLMLPKRLHSAISFPSHGLVQDCIISSALQCLRKLHRNISLADDSYSMADVEANFVLHQNVLNTSQNALIGWCSWI